MDQVIPKNEEYLHDKSTIISQTDTKGIITYVNKKFCEISGYNREELVGSPHSIIRHPDMPKEVFQKMWETIQDAQTWNGLIKNLRKDGLYYWVETEILPTFDDAEKITGYIAIRRESSRKNIEESEALYKKMFQKENKD